MTNTKLSSDVILAMSKVMGVPESPIEGANPLRIPPIEDENGNANITVTGEPGLAFLSYKAEIDGEVRTIKVGYGFEIEQGTVVGPFDTYPLSPRDHVSEYNADSREIEEDFNGLDLNN